MKKVIWEDKNGYKHLSTLRDSDPDSMAPQGIPSDPPDLNKLDWDAMKRDLHNALLDMGLFTWGDVMRSRAGVAPAVVSVLKQRLIILYRTSPNGGDIKEA